MTNPLLRSTLGTICILSGQMSFAAQTFDPRSLEASIRVINDDVTTTWYMTDANGNSYPMTTTDYDDDYAAQIYSNNKFLAREHIYETRQSPAQKAQSIADEIAKLRGQGRRVMITATSEGWLWPVATNELNEVPVAKPYLAPDLIDPRNVYIANKSNRLEIWLGDKLIAAEQMNDDDNAFAKNYHLIDSQLEACRKQTLLKLTVTPESWIWVDPTDQSVYQPSRKNDYAVRMKSETEVEVLQSGKGIFTETSYTSKDDAWNKHIALREQLLEACRMQRGIEAQTSDDNKWIWLDVMSAQKSGLPAEAPN